MERLSRVTPATIDVLKVLVAAEGAVWGLQIVKTTGRPSGSVYPILDRLESLGWVASAWEDDTSRQGARRRYYRLQEQARDLAVAAVATLENKQATTRSPRMRPAGLAGA
ncbi:MAG: helix-turn-helix transcriptional regulator [Cryobacterium sp.]|jgi:DNA-binding IclR family transcriptional regulator